jgi:hypothetical protein
MDFSQKIKRLVSFVRQYSIFGSNSWFLKTYLTYMQAFNGTYQTQHIYFG